MTSQDGCKPTYLSYDVQGYPDLHLTYFFLGRKTFPAEITSLVSSLSTETWQVPVIGRSVYQHKGKKHKVNLVSLPNPLITRRQLFVDIIQDHDLVDSDNSTFLHTYSPHITVPDFLDTPFITITNLSIKNP